ncbi:MAG: murein biosynthesis integral membrane protein MurJ [Candidatus Nanopelagicales bacterium]
MAEDPGDHPQDPAGDEPADEPGAPGPPDDPELSDRTELSDLAGSPDPDAASDSAAQAAAPQQSELISKGAAMAVGTVISRVTGLFRDVAMTAALGLGVVADIFTVGNTIPNTVYVLTVGGAMNAVFVPQLVRRSREDSDGGTGFTDRLITLTVILLLALTAISILLAPWLTRIYASPSYTAEQMSLAVAFARFCLPQVFFYGLFTLLTQVLNARGRFSPPMYAPIANNIVAISVFMSFLVIAGPQAAQSGTLNAAQTAWLGLGSTIAVAAQALLLVPYMASAGYRWRPRFDFRGWGLGKTGGLALWTLGLLAANQVSFIVHSRLATTANVLAEQAGTAAAGITTYQKAYLIFFLPHSIVTVSLVTALLPGLSRVAHARQFDSFARVLTDTMRTVTALAVPISAVMMALAPALSSLLFGVGASDRASASVVGFTVIGMLVGLVPFSIYFILLRGWYSVEDTKTPFLLSLVLNTINVVLSIGLFRLAPLDLKVPALGVAFGLTYWLMMPIAWPLLARRTAPLHTRTTWLAVLRMLAAGALAAAATLMTFVGFDQYVNDPYTSRWTLLTSMALASLAGLLAYLLAARLLRIEEVGKAVRMVRRRVGR